MVDSSQMVLWPLTLVAVLVRVGGIFVIAPVFSHPALPARIRAFMGLVIALAAAARMAVPIAMPGGWAELLAGLGFEAMVGLTIGFAARLMFVGIELGAVHVGRQIGVSLAESFDPSGEQSCPAVRQMFRLLALVIFLAIGGHRELISATLGTFEAVPPLGLAAIGGTLEMIVVLLAASFTVALKVAAAVLVTMLLVTVAMGLIQRTVPQVHILSAGMPIRVMVGLTVLAATLAVMLPLVEQAWRMTAGHLLGWIEG